VRLSIVVWGFVAGLILDLLVPLLVQIWDRLLVGDWIGSSLILSDELLVLARLHLHVHILWEVRRMLLRRRFLGRNGLWVRLNGSSNLVQIGIIRCSVNVHSLDISRSLSFHTSLRLFVGSDLDVLHLDAKNLQNLVLRIGFCKLLYDAVDDFSGLLSSTTDVGSQV